MMDEGYIKFTNHWEKKPVFVPTSILIEINEVRQELKKLGMLGKIPGGPSFGNLSVRFVKNSFFITGSDTGGFELLSANQIALVTESNIYKNQISSEGLIAASSESMSHAVLYETISAISSVIHIHHASFWNYYRNQIPTTPKEISYGTAELAISLIRLARENPTEGVFILGGHRDGVISVGNGLQEAFNKLLFLNGFIHEKTKNNL